MPYNPPSMLKPGNRVAHRFNPELGPGVVAEVRGKNAVVDFPDRGERLHFALDSDALEPLVLAPGARARLAATGETVVVEAMIAGGRCRLADGREVPADDLWPLPVELPLEERLARGRLDGFEDLVNRLDGLRLLRLREASGLGSFLGGRVQLFPHQLYAAERACLTDPVRWLLADEVGLGKTVEACLILARLLHTRRAERVLVVAPETLTLQWLGELWRKYHQTFALLDDRRLADLVKDHGADANPFDVHRRAVLGLETLIARPRLTEQAVAAGIDLLVVDEAHHLRRPPGHPGNPAWRAVAPIAALGRHALLLSATPLEDDAHGFFRLLQLLRPEEFPEEGGFEARLARREPLPPCTSAARRADIGGLPPRQPAPVEIAGPPAAAGWQALDRLVEHLRTLPAGDALARRKKAERVARALSSPAALAAGLDRAEREDPALASLVEEARQKDPRVAWLVEQAGHWTKAGEKTLVFVAHRETLDELKKAIELAARGRVGVFHEELSPERRDIEVAQFRLPDGPAVLIATECGGEGRNFQFCRRLVLFDLPWNPTVVEQRIGRLDRIGRTIPTEIVYFRPEIRLGRAVADFYERIGIFEEPLGGLERELRHAAHALEQAAVAGPGEVSPEDFAAVLAEAREAQDRVRTAAYHELHRDPYRAEMAPAILARVPADLDEVTEDVVVRAVSRFGFDVEEQRGEGTFRIEFGYEAFLDHLPGVPPGAAFLGTFDREAGVDDESLDFFASGHPLVEGVLTELEEGPRGRVTAFQIAGGEDLFALLALYKRGAEIEAVVVDSAGRPRPDWAEKLVAAPIVPEPVEIKKWTAQAGWEKTIRRLAGFLPPDETPQALAAFRVRKAAPRA